MTNYRENDQIDNRYLLKRHLGTGGFADVFAARDTLSNTQIAIKLYNRMDSNGIQVFQQEYSKVLHLNHQYLIKAQHFGIYENRPYLIMPLCKHGNLTRLLVDKYQILPEYNLLDILLQVSKGLAYLHQKGIVHQDIKPDNILEIEEGEFVISDFGISQRLRSTIAKSVRRTEKMTSSSGFTSAYAPPIQERYSIKPSPYFDIFSLGVTMYELAAKQLPYTDTGEAISNRLSIPALPSGHYSQEFENILRQCMHADPQQRPSASELIQQVDSLQTGSVHPANSIPYRKTQPMPTKAFVAESVEDYYSTPKHAYNTDRQFATDGQTPPPVPRQNFYQTPVETLVYQQPVSPTLSHPDYVPAKSGWGYYLDIFRYNYANFKGRARRKEYWHFALFNNLIFITIGLLFGIIDGATEAAYSETIESLLFSIAGIFILLTLIPGLAVFVRRLHDTGKSGWWFLIGCIPFIGSIVLIVFLFQDSEKETNKYGVSPKYIVNPRRLT